MCGVQGKTDPKSRALPLRFVHCFQFRGLAVPDAQMWSDAIPLDQIRYNEQALVPAIVQDHLDGTVLMMGWMRMANRFHRIYRCRCWMINYGRLPMTSRTIFYPGC